MVDDANEAKGHRNNIFSTSFNVAGIAAGPHTTFGLVACELFATEFIDHASVPVEVEEEVIETEVDDVSVGTPEPIVFNAYYDAEGTEIELYDDENNIVYASEVDPLG